MGRLILFIATATSLGCTADDAFEFGDDLVKRAMGDNYGPVFTGETRGEYHDRIEREQYGYVKHPYASHKR